MYNNFIGIDIGKFEFVVALNGSKSSKIFDNDASGIDKFLTQYKSALAESLCVLEATGGYEFKLLLQLCEKGVPTHRADARKVKKRYSLFW